MCGIVGFLDKTAGANTGRPTGAILLSMLQALACRGPDGAGVAMIRDRPQFESLFTWSIRIAPDEPAALERLRKLGDVGKVERGAGGTLAFRFVPKRETTIADVESALSATRGGLEVLSLGKSLDLVKRVGSPDELESIFKVSEWTGPVGIGHTRMSTESRIDLSHSQPFWAHGVLDLATAHNGHVTNYHKLRRKYEQEGVTFYTDNDSEVIGVYLRDRLEKGRSLAEAMADSINDLDGAFNYLVASTEGLGIVRDRHGFKPMMMAETDEFLAFGTEEIALRRALPGSYKVSEPKPGLALFHPLQTLVAGGNR